MKPAIIKFLATALGIFWLVSAFAAEVIPPKPAQYFNDYAAVVSPATAAQLNAQLEQFERDSYNQVVVAIYPKMQSDSSVNDYCVRVFNTWHVGQADKKNGAVLFVFVQDHKMFLSTGYGLEGALPDATCKDIIEDVIKPRFKANDFAGGFAAGINAIIAATKGEYHGTGRTVAEGKANKQPGMAAFVFFIFIFVIIALVLSRSKNSGALYSNTGWIIGNIIGGIGSSRGGGSDWGGGGGGGGGFSGGGGSSGGGGAGGSW